ncbi:hypothetical protein Cgig2_011593 [Carnegiea gigantea]|uniref:Uncharacterized protein n=1 Tax=Carnegiea gigantea TaxID=171969 RepID=A0A9Q1JS55_9CARY|nr:hypothetical protein Cgig2_011593 [Carnegiea gigantea]
MLMFMDLLSMNIDGLVDDTNLLCPCQWMIDSHKMRAFPLTITSSREHMAEREGLVQAFDIDPPTYVPQLPRIISPHVCNIRYGGWMDNMYLFVLRSRHQVAAIDVDMTMLEELDSVLYDIHTRTTTNRSGMPQGVPESTTNDVHIYIWNCRGFPRASFRPNLFT